jgi:DNA polymerase
MPGGFVILDVETRSTLDLRKVGVARYASHPSTDLWCVAWAVDDQCVQRWLPSNPVPKEILEATVDSSYVFVAHNAAFERAIFQHILTPRYGWPEIPIERWRCTQAASLALALPPKLAKVAEVLRLPQQKANPSIVALTCKPRRPRGDEDPNAGPFWHDDAEHLTALGEYCKQDIQTERALWRWLSPLIPSEQALWELDQRINDRGFYVDGQLIEAAANIVAAAEAAIQAELRQLTGNEIESTHQVARLLAWLAAHGCELKDLQKGTLSHALRRTELDPVTRRVLELRKESAHAAAAKMSALRAWRNGDGRVRGAFRYHGAATGRWASVGVQVQNFRREAEGTEAKLAAVMSGDIEQVRALGSPIEIVGDIARAAICAPPGKRLLVGDFSGIESRVLAWIADEPSKLELWAKFDRTQNPDNDPYVVIGRALGHPEDTARAKGKVADLAFGYQGGAGAYKNFAPADDTASEAEIQAFKQAWRDRHPYVVQFWYGVDRCAIQAVNRCPAPIKYGRLVLQCEQRGSAKFLFITLPSGRRLAYPFVKLITNRFNRPAVEFMDNSQIAGWWAPCNFGHGAYGGLWTENIVSGIARDLLAAAITRLEAAGYPVVLHVHDEIVVELRDSEGSLDEFRYLITRLPEWAKGLSVSVSAA